MRQLSPYCSHLVSPPRGGGATMVTVRTPAEGVAAAGGKPRSQPGFDALRNFDPANVALGSFASTVLRHAGCFCRQFPQGVRFAAPSPPRFACVVPAAIPRVSVVAASSVAAGCSPLVQAISPSSFAKVGSRQDHFKD
jgi:hypothetical protein